MNISDQIELAAWEHELRAPDGRWVHGGGYGHDSAPVHRLAELFTSGALQHAHAVRGDRPEQGAQGKTSILTLPDGRKVLRKTQDPKWNDSEELAYYVSQALGGGSGLPALARNPHNPREIVEDVVPGKVAWRYAIDETKPGGNWSGFDEAEVLDDMPSTQAGYDIGLLDTLTGNYDRHDANYMIDSSGSPHAIDMGAAQWDGFTDSVFRSLDEGDLPADQAAKYARELHKIEPEFRRLGHEDWYVVMMDTLSRLSAGPSLSGQLANSIELAGGLAWLHELRDADGKWTHSPTGQVGTGIHRYAAPDHSRLINDRADHPDPADYPFFKKHPVSVKNVIDAYDAVTPEMKEAGRHWYSDAHLLAKAIAGGDAEKGSILLSTYSPQANWPINMFRAARAFDDNKPIPAGEGFVSGDQVKKAQRALDGEHIDQILVSPKIRSFAKLISQGDDSPDDPYGHVVINAHALNVAAGGDIRGATYGHTEKGSKAPKIPPEDDPPIGKDVRAHEYVGDMYREAAQIISQREGRLMKPHELQAITWVGQVLANQAADRAMVDEGSAKGRLSARAKDWQRWLAWAKEHDIPLQSGVSALAAQIAEMLGEGSLASQIELAYDPEQLRGPDGRWIRGVGHAELQLITAAEARGDSRPVSRAEFTRLAALGKARLAAMNGRQPITGLTAHWEAIKAKTYQQVQAPWGGATIDAHTGIPLEDGADKYAITAKPAGLDKVSVPEHASEAQFNAAMDIALGRFRADLEKGQRHIGVFHDDDNNRIDIDPVVVVGSIPEVEQIGAYTHAIGGAYHFASGDGFWPPHVAEAVTMTADGGRTHFAGPGQWRSQAEQVQEGLSPEQLAEIEEAATSQLSHTLDAGTREMDMTYDPEEPRDKAGRWVGAETWYHLTDNPKFSLDPGYSPEDNAISIAPREGSGVYLTKDPESWVNGHDYVRPYVAEVRAHPSVHEAEGPNSRWGGEMFVPSDKFSKLQVHRLIPLDAYAREEYGEHGWIESHHETEFDTGKPIPPNTGFGPYTRPFPGSYHYPGPDVRDMPQAETDRLKERWLAYLKENRKFSDEDVEWYRQHTGQPPTVIQAETSSTLAAQIELGYDPAEPRNAHGEWMPLGGGQVPRKGSRIRHKDGRTGTVISDVRYRRNAGRNAKEVTVAWDNGDEHSVLVRSLAAHAKPAAVTLAAQIELGAHVCGNCGCSG